MRKGLVSPALKMSGIHLPDIGKLGIHIATGMKDKKKVAPSNMAESARFRAISTRIDNEKQERRRVLKTEERKMKLKKHNIDKRRHDIQRNKKGDSKFNIDIKSRKRSFPPLITYRKTVCEQNENLKEVEKEVERYANFDCSQTFGIFPIREDFRCLDNKESCKTEIRKIILPPIETETRMRRKISSSPSKGKTETTADDENAARDDMISKHNSGGSSKLDDPVLRGISLAVKSKQVTTEACIFKKDVDAVEFSVRHGLQGKEASQEKIQATRIDFNDKLLNEETGSDLGHVDIINSSANPFNYLLVEAQRRKIVHELNFEEAFRTIRTCRYLRTPSRKERESHDQ